MIRVTKLTDYATLVLTVLARSPERVASAAGLAESAQLETTTVAKVLKPLAAAGLVASFRGAAGGYRLARPAAAITLLEVVEAIEGRLGMTECSVHAGSCGRESSCGMRANWRRINDVVADALRAVTLQDMLDGATASLPAPRDGAATPAARAIPARLQAS